jgi:hypothetical protein
MTNDNDDVKVVVVRYTATFSDSFEVPADWEWDGSLRSLLEYTDLPYLDGMLTSWTVEG